MSAPLQADDIRLSNRSAVLRALLRRGPASRATISSSTGLSIPTVAAILAEFTSLGLVQPDGRELTTGGRPARRVALRPDVRHVLAVDLAATRARAFRIDIAGNVTGEASGPSIRPGMDGDLLDWLGNLLQAKEEPPVTRLALAVPGAVDPEEGRVQLAPALGWNDIRLADLLEAQLGVPTTVENDVNSLALAELAFGSGVGARNLLYVAIGNGVGAALVVHGQLVRGANAKAGEIGYARSGLADPAASKSEGAGGPFERGLLALADRFTDRDGFVAPDSDEAQEAFERFVTALHQTLHNLVCALDPELLVIAWPRDPRNLLSTRLSQLWQGPSPLRIVASALGSEAAALGVGWLALERVHDELCLAAGTYAQEQAGSGSPPSSNSSGAALEAVTASERGTPRSAAEFPGEGAGTSPDRPVREEEDRNRHG